VHFVNTCVQKLSCVIFVFSWKNKMKFAKFKSSFKKQLLSNYISLNKHTKLSSFASIAIVCITRLVLRCLRWLLDTKTLTDQIRSLLSGVFFLYIVLMKPIVCLYMIIWKIKYFYLFLSEKQLANKVRFRTLPLRYWSSIPSAVLNFASSCKYLCLVFFFMFVFVLTLEKT